MCSWTNRTVLNVASMKFKGPSTVMNRREGFCFCSSLRNNYIKTPSQTAVIPLNRYTEATYIYEYIYIKPETHRANRWPSEASGETRTSSGTNLFGVFSCVGSFWKRVEQHLLRFNLWSLRTLAVGRHRILWLVVCSLYDHPDWRCASESARCVGGVEFCVATELCGVRFVFLCTPFRHFLFSCFGLLAQD